MKKIARIFTPVLIVAALLLVPLSTHAQVIDLPNEEEPTPTTTTEEIPSTGAAPTPTVAPDTGFSPSENKVLANLSIFVIGGAMGGALGYGVVFLKKKYNS
jgi:hypothetical protein